MSNTKKQVIVILVDIFLSKKWELVFVTDNSFNNMNEVSQKSVH